MKHVYTQSNNVQPLPIWPTPNYPFPAPGNSKQLVNKLFPKWTAKKDPNHPTKSNVTQHTIYQHPRNSNRLYNIETRNNSRKLPGTMENEATRTKSLMHDYPSRWTPETRSHDPCSAGRKGSSLSSSNCLILRNELALLCRRWWKKTISYSPHA